MKTKTLTHKMRETLAVFAAISGMLMPMTASAADSTTVSESSTAACSVSAVVETSFSVTIPTHITMDVDSRAGTGTGNYSVGVSGQIESGHCITVEPDSSFIMSHNNEKLTASATQDITSFDSDLLTLDTPLMTTGSVSVSGLKGGQYDGIFNFHIAELDHQHSYGDDARCVVCGKLDPDHQHNYGDNAHCILCDKLNPDHVHSYGADSRCVCGMIDPNHVHSYQSNGMCECGAENPDVNFVTFSKSMYKTIFSSVPSTQNDRIQLTVCDKSAEELGHTLAAGNCKDVSVLGDGSVLGWYTGNSVLDSCTMYVAPAHTGSVLRAPSDCSYLFYIDEYGADKSYQDGIWSISGLSNIDWRYATDVSCMFFDCGGLTDLDLSGFDTSNMTDIHGMFSGCSSLTDLDLRGFNTSNVINMSSMFSGCSGLTDLDLKGFDTSNVLSMEHMFYGCSGLTGLDLKGFDTSNVLSMSQMFSHCSGLTDLDLSNFDTGNVKDIWCMFADCRNLSSLDLRGFDTNNMTTATSVFQGCNSLDTIRVTRGKWTLSAGLTSLSNSSALKYE